MLANYQKFQQSNKFLPQQRITLYAFKAIIIYCDNHGAVALGKTPESHARTKHIRSPKMRDRPREKIVLLEEKPYPNV